MPRKPRAVAALPIIDVQTEARILAYHSGREAAADETELAQPRIGVREVQSELHTDLWTALMQGVV